MLHKILIASLDGQRNLEACLNSELERFTILPGVLKTSNSYSLTVMLTSKWLKRWPLTAILLWLATQLLLHAPLPLYFHHRLFIPLHLLLHPILLAQVTSSPLKPMFSGMVTLLIALFRFIKRSILLPFKS